MQLVSILICWWNFLKCCSAISKICVLNLTNKLVSTLTLKKIPSGLAVLLNLKSNEKKRQTSIISIVWVILTSFQQRSIVRYTYFTKTSFYRQHKLRFILVVVGVKRHHRFHSGRIYTNTLHNDLEVKEILHFHVRKSVKIKE